MNAANVLKKLAPPLAGAALVVASLALYFGVRAGWRSELAAQEAKIRDLKAQIEVQKAVGSDKVEEVVWDTTALNMARVASDRIQVEDLMTLVMTWDSYASYKQVREDVMVKYGLAPGSDFMRMFLPEIPELIGEDGTSYNIIDTPHIDGTAGYNMQFESADLYVLGISGDTYTYMAFVTWSTVSGTGYEGLHTDTIRLSVGADGVISDLRGYLGMA